MKIKRRMYIKNRNNSSKLQFIMNIFTNDDSSLQKVQKSICVDYNSKYITNMYEGEEQEEVRDPDADLPPYKIRHNDMKLQNIKLIVRKAAQFIKEQLKKPQPMLEKDICLKLVQYLKENKADFGAGEGQWQCIIGKNLAACLNYDLHQLTFLDLPQYGYSILVFKSG